MFVCARVYLPETSDEKSIFERSTIGLNLELSFSHAACLTNMKKVQSSPITNDQSYADNTY